MAYCQIVFDFRRNEHVCLSKTTNFAQNIQGNVFVVSDFFLKMMLKVVFVTANISTDF